MRLLSSTEILKWRLCIVVCSIGRVKNKLDKLAKPVTQSRILTTSTTSSSLVVLLSHNDNKETKKVKTRMKMNGAFEKRTLLKESIQERAFLRTNRFKFKFVINSVTNALKLKKRRI